MEIKALFFCFRSLIFKIVLKFVKKDSIITKESMFEYYSSLLDVEIDQESVCTKLPKEQYNPEEDLIWESLA